MTQGNADPPLTAADMAYGNNSLDAKNIFLEKKKYREDIFYPTLISNFRNTWGKDAYYGILNTKGNAVIVEENKLKPLRYAGDRTLFALNFVADAWRDFSQKMRDLATANILHRDSPWAAPEATKGWSAPTQLYQEYLLDAVYPAFSQVYLSLQSADEKIKDFESYLEVFSEYVEEVQAKGGPMTLSGFVESPSCPLFVSGLVIEIGGEADDYDDDLTKTQVYKDGNFQLAASIASQYGFSVDRDIPWRLVADLNNPAMREYMHGLPIVDIEVDNKNGILCDDPILRQVVRPPEAFGYSQVAGLEAVRRRMNIYLTSEGVAVAGYLNFQNLHTQKTSMDAYDTLFSTTFTETWPNDISILRSYLFAFYSALVSNDPVKSIYVSRPNCATGVTELVTRASVQPEIMSATEGPYGNIWSLKTFYTLRLLERGHNLSSRQQKKEIQSAVNTYYFSPGGEGAQTKSALQYIQQNYVGPVPTQALTHLTVGDTLSL